MKKIKNQNKKQYLVSINYQNESKIIYRNKQIENFKKIMVQYILNQNILKKQ